MENDKEFLGREPIHKLLMKLAVPTVLAQVVNMLYNIIDRIYIGHMPTDSALALIGVGVCMPLILLIAAFAALVSSGGAPRASISMGKHDYDRAEHILGNCFSLLVMISAVLTILILLFNKNILLLFGASENTIGYASSYMTIYAIGTIFVQLTLGMNMFITAQGFAKIGMLTVLIGAIFNIVLDPVFIFGLNMGVQGAALATIVSQAVSCIWCLKFLTGPKTYLRIKREYMPLKKEIIVPCVTLGLAAFIMQISESIVAVCFNSSLLKYGGDIAVGAMTVCTSTMQFAMLPMQGIGQGAQPISSYNFGAGNKERVKDTFMLLLKVCSVYAIVFWLAVMLFPQVIAGIFTSDPELIAYAAKALRIYCAGVFLFGIQISCQLTFTSIGNAVYSILVAVIRKFILLIPFIYLLPAIDILNNKALDVYLAEPAADVIAVICTASIFFVQFRKALNGMRLPEEKTEDLKDAVKGALAEANEETKNLLDQANQAAAKSEQVLSTAADDIKAAAKEAKAEADAKADDLRDAVKGALAEANEETKNLADQANKTAVENEKVLSKAADDIADAVEDAVRKVTE